MSGRTLGVAEAVNRTAPLGNRPQYGPSGNRDPSLFRVAHGCILYKDKCMRLVMVVLACTAALSGRVVESDASARLKEFKQYLENAMKLAGVGALQQRPQLMASPNRVCAIPLARVGPSATFKSNMPVLTPGSDVKFSVRRVDPPAPSCDVQEDK